MIKVRSLTSVKACKLCSTTLNAPLQAVQHYKGKNHAKRLRLFVNTDGNLAMGKATNIMSQGLGAVEKERDVKEMMDSFDVSTVMACICRLLTSDITFWWMVFL